MLYDQFLEREKELLQLNAELNTKCHTVMESAKESANSQMKAIKSKQIYNKMDYQESVAPCGRKESLKSVIKTPLQDANERRRPSEPERDNHKAAMARHSHPTIGFKQNTEVKKHVSTDGLIKFLKAKVCVLQQELELCQKDNIKKTEALEACVESNKKLEALKEQATAKANTLKAQLIKAEDKYKADELRIKEKENEQCNLSKELEGMRKELKSLAQLNHSLEKRMFRLNEDLENTRAELAAAKETEKTLRKSQRQEQLKLEREVALLRKERMELVDAYKKQLFLIDNLKRQIVCLEQSKMIELREKEFVKLLDWKVNQK